LKVTFGYGQIFHTDPYLIDLIGFNIDQTKKEIVTNKIKKVSSFYSYLKKDGSKKKKNKLIYSLDIDSYGNPSYYQHQYSMACWWWPTFLQSLKLQKKRTDTYEYHFQYDNTNNLTHISEIFIETSYPTHSEIDIYNYYDENNRLKKQTYSDKTIYKPGYKYAGSSYENDTTIFNYNLEYSSNGNVSTILRQKSTFEYQEEINKERRETKLDTLIFNCPFDSIFIEKEIQKGIKKDSLQRIIETTTYSSIAKPMGGGPCFSTDSPNDRITKYYYADNGKLIKTESFLRSGAFVGSQLWEYYDNGLIKTITNKESNHIIYYAYEFY
jgi:hypothetical protein